MDVRMPIMDGIEATRQDRGAARGPPPRVLVMTTFDLDEYIIDALRAGASGFLVKDCTGGGAGARGAADRRAVRPCSRRRSPGGSWTCGADAAPRADRRRGTRRWRHHRTRAGRC